MILNPLFLVLVFCWVLSQVFCNIRGVHPDLRKLYEPNSKGQFQCLYSKELIDFSCVNDNYCDCQDGTDEPGTSACPNGVFTCKSPLSHPRTISSSKVDDGICDCCDGSDESNVKCENTCQSLYNQKKIEENGYYLRQQLITDAKLIKDNLKHSLALLEEKLQNCQKKDSSLQASKTQVARLLEKLSSNSTQLLQNNEKLLKKIQFLEELFEGLVNNSQVSSLIPQEISKYKDYQANFDSRYSSPSETITESDASTQRESSTSYFKNLLEKGKAFLNTNKAVVSSKKFLSPLSKYFKKEYFYSKFDSSNSYHATSSKLKTLENELNENKVTQENLLKDKRQIEVKLNENYGLFSELIGMHGKCFNFEHNKNKYVICPFENATQITQSGQKLSLGNWEKLHIDPQSKQTKMLFKYGSYCSKDKYRSLSIELQCGEKEEIIYFSEPQICTYEAILVTPCVCYENPLLSVYPSEEPQQQEELCSSGQCHVKPESHSSHQAGNYENDDDDYDENLIFKEDSRHLEL